MHAFSGNAQVRSALRYEGVTAHDELMTAYFCIFTVIRINLDAATDSKNHIDWRRVDLGGHFH